MNTIPAISSTLSALHVGHLVAGHYFPGSQISCRLLRAGINDAYLISADEERYVFRIYSHGWRTHKEIEAECALLLQLKTAGISVSYPIPSIGKNHILSIAAPKAGASLYYFPMQQVTSCTIIMTPCTEMRVY